MGEAVAQCHVHHLGLGQAEQQLAAGRLEAQVGQHRPWRLAEEDLELALQGPPRLPGRGGEIGNRPVMADIGAHRLERATYAARQGRCSRNVVSLGHCGRGP